MTNVLENEYILNQFAVDLVVLHSAGSCHRAMKLAHRWPNFSKAQKSIHPLQQIITFF